ncbi:MAG: Asp-tRNA(Asn)/Glu-tRNA(Gln) amidotransferase subunit GatB [Nitrospinae bacterium]|jgi:aspartyl-tRNA(Asn)/glutamyl-tRNA(Gln) amidotransferase subunit B|nr:Asp-tRNA(Asn)/Glu-tRNA(Gln) amidotransferase subunit GatB [Nitrospinota bacterium]MDA1109033.1 Asp-tRNA(Asn)/Glu-tRNA(Gln) amidotransferase subunit GatB [Nitrospinota bacterium]
MKYEIVIGLEVHAQLKTQTKIFCSCSTEFGRPANENTCPICLGMPGVLPVLNKQAVDFAIKACLATCCQVNSHNQFDRKNYFYPDLPKGYQITQLDLPIGEHGHINIEVDGKKKCVGVTRIHMEEDAGKLIHGENMDSPGKSYVDLNRTGTPLIEIVSEPDLRSPEEAREYLTQLKAILEYTEVSDCNMEEGSLRCDANISLRPVGQKEFGTRTELKNLNSFRFVQKAIEYEVERQTQILEQGDKVIQETRLYDSDKGVTRSMRSKEEAHDYRYFPEPDLVRLMIAPEEIEKIRKTIPELPEQKRQRFVTEHEIPEYDAGVLTSSLALANYYEECIALLAQPKIISNWVMGDLLRELKNDDREIENCPLTPEALTDLLKLIEKGTISGKMAKTVFEEMYQSGRPADEIVKQKGMTQISDSGAIEKMIDDVISANPQQLEGYRNGKETLLGYFVGQVMKASKGQANPALVNQLLKDKLAP